MTIKCVNRSSNCPAECHRAEGALFGGDNDTFPLKGQTCCPIGHNTRWFGYLSNMENWGGGATIENIRKRSIDRHHELLEEEAARTRARATYKQQQEDHRQYADGEVVRIVIGGDSRYELSF